MVIITTLVLVGVFGTGITARRVGAGYGLLPLASTGLARSATVLASIWHSSWVLSVLIVLWLLALVLYPVLGVGVLVQMMVLAWANGRLFSRDVLAEFTSSQERDALLKQHRGALWGLGLIASVPAAIPSFIWAFGAAITIALPVMALFAVWLYVMIFLATSLLFSHYLLPALKTMRDQSALQQAALDAKARKEQAQQDANAIETSATQAPTLNVPNTASPAIPAPTLPAPSL
jgi:ABC-type protease/lipase transport system fused ATPase/permease subunit